LQVQWGPQAVLIPQHPDLLATGKTAFCPLTQIRSHTSSYKHCDWMPLWSYLLLPYNQRWLVRRSLSPEQCHPGWPSYFMRLTTKGSVLPALAATKNAIIPPLILPRILWPRRYTYTPGYTPSPGCRAHLRFRSPVGGQKLGCFLVRHIRGNAKALKCMWSYARGDAGAAANADAKEVSNPQPDANAPLLDLRRMQRTLSSRPPSSTRLRFRCYAKRARRALYWSSRTNAAKILRR